MLSFPWTSVELLLFFVEDTGTECACDSNEKTFHKVLVSCNKKIQVWLLRWEAKHSSWAWRGEGVSKFSMAKCPWLSQLGKDWENGPVVSLCWVHYLNCLVLSSGQRTWVLFVPSTIQQLVFSVALQISLLHSCKRDQWGGRIRYNKID